MKSLTADCVDDRSLIAGMTGLASAWGSMKIAFTKNVVEVKRSQVMLNRFMPDVPAALSLATVVIAATLACCAKAPQMPNSFAALSKRGADLDAWLAAVRARGLRTVVDVAGR